MELVYDHSEQAAGLRAEAFLYGLTIVFFGLLQAYRGSPRTRGSSVASLVLIWSYLTFAVLGRRSTLASLSLPD